MVSGGTPCVAVDGAPTCVAHFRAWEPPPSPKSGPYWHLWYQLDAAPPFGVRAISNPFRFAAHFGDVRDHVQGRLGLPRCLQAVEQTSELELARERFGGRDVGLGVKVGGDFTREGVKRKRRRCLRARRPYLLREHVHAAIRDLRGQGQLLQACRRTRCNQSRPTSARRGCRPRPACLGRARGIVVAPRVVRRPTWCTRCTRAYLCGPRGRRQRRRTRGAGRAARGAYHLSDAPGRRRRWRARSLSSSKATTAMPNVKRRSRRRRPQASPIACSRRFFRAAGVSSTSWPSRCTQMPPRRSSP